MDKRFVESPNFLEWVRAHPPSWDETYVALQKTLMADPNVGRVMKGCGGLRKVRIPDPGRGKGKRGGARVIYLHVPEADWIYMMDIYDKNKREDLSPKKRKLLAELAAGYRAAAIASTLRSKEEES